MTYTETNRARNKVKKQWLFACLFISGLSLFDGIYTFFELADANSMTMAEAFLQGTVGPMLSSLGSLAIGYYCACFNPGTKWLKMVLLLMPLTFLSQLIQTIKEVAPILEKKPFLDWLQVGGVFVALWISSTIFFLVKSFQLHRANIQYKRAVIAAENQSSQETT